MDIYIVSGIVQVCIFSQWSEHPVRAEMRALNRDAAKDAALELERRIAERQDPYATVRWHTPEWVQAQHDTPDAGRGLARLLWRNYAYAIGQLGQLSEYDRRVMAGAVVRYYQSYGAKEDLTASRLLAEWQIAIDRRAQQCAVGS